MTDQSRRTVMRLVGGTAVVGGTGAAIPDLGLAALPGNPEAELAVLFEHFMAAEREWSALGDEQDNIIVARRSAFGTERAKLKAAGLRIDNQVAAVVARQDRTLDLMNETPARTPQGVLYKLLAAARYDSWDDPRMDHDPPELMVLAAIDDLKRMAG